MKNSVREIDFNKPAYAYQQVRSAVEPDDGIDPASFRKPGFPARLRSTGTTDTGSTRKPGAAAMFLALVLGALAPGLASVALAQELVGAPGEAAEVTGININIASADELAQKLNGVGGSKAEAIIRYREQFGAFESVEELTEVQGIGSAILERNRGMIRVN